MDSNQVIREHIKKEQEKYDELFRCNAKTLSTERCIYMNDSHPVSDLGSKRHFDGKYYWGGYTNG